MGFGPPPHKNTQFRETMLSCCSCYHVIMLFMTGRPKKFFGVFVCFFWVEMNDYSTKNVKVLKKSLADRFDRTICGDRGVVTILPQQISCMVRQWVDVINLGWERY